MSRFGWFSDEKFEIRKTFEYLRKEGNSYYFTNTSSYVVHGVIDARELEEVFNFAYDMTFGRAGQHRDHRSGGNLQRKNGEIFANTFQGKLAECAACRLFQNIEPGVAPDFSVYKLGAWDTSDLSVRGKEISVKSTKSFGQLLLLETQDWDCNGVYLPNAEQGNGFYDIILFIRLDPSCEDLLKNIRCLYSQSVDYDEIKSLIFSQRWTYNYAGYITNEDLKYIIRNRYILPQGSFLNGKRRMDASNYYVQSGDLRSVSTLESLF